MSYPHMAAGWAVAGDTPFTWTKQVASNFGGTRNGMVVYWPKRIKAKGEVRSQFHHVIDVAPTVLEAAGLPEPKVVNGTPQTPIEGVSMVYTFDDAKADEPAQGPVLRDDRQPRHLRRRVVRRHHPQGAVGSRSRAPRSSTTSGSSTTRGTTSAWRNDLAAQNPAKLKELQDLFMKEAVKYNVLPIDDRSIERLNPKLAGRPDLMGDRTSLTLYAGMTGMSENAFINVKNRSLTITADVEIPAGGANGVILAQGGTVRRVEPLHEGRQADLRLQLPGPAAVHRRLAAGCAAGKATIRFEFAYDGGGLAKGGLGTIYVNDKKVAEGRIERTQPIVFSAGRCGGRGHRRGHAGHRGVQAC